MAKREVLADGATAGPAAPLDEEVERLGQANLTRVLNLMSAAGLVERSTHGREAVFRLSRRGLEARSARPGRKRRASPPPIAAGTGPG